MTIVTLKLTDTEAHVLQELVLFTPFKSKSECLRKGLYTLAAQRKLKPAAAAALADERKIHRPRRHNHTASNKTATTTTPAARPTKKR